MEALKKWLLENEVKQVSMAKELGVSCQLFNLWIKEKSTPKIRHLKKLSIITGISINELLDMKNLSYSAEVISEEERSKNIQELYQAVDFQAIDDFFNKFKTDDGDDIA